MLKKILIFVSIMALFCTTSPAFALGNLRDAGKNLTPASQTAGYSADQGNLGTLTGQIINVALSLVGIIFLALMVYAGYLWMTAQGDESEIEKAKKIITSAIIGLVLTMSAYAITALVTSKFSSPAQAPGGAAGAAAQGNECMDACAQGNPAQLQACLAGCH